MKLNKHFIFSVLTCSFMLLSCRVQGQTQEVNKITAQQGSQASKKIVSSNTPKPRIVFENKLIDFGKIGPESKPSGEFRFTNTGNAVLEIIKISQCCGVTISNEKSKYEPGEKGVIKVSYTATTQTGKISRQPVVNSNDPVEPNLALMVLAEVVNKVTAQPERIKLFLNEDNAKCPKVTIKSSDKQPFSIRGIQSTGNCVTARYDPNTKAIEYVLDLKVDMAKLQQDTKGNVDIIINHPEMSLVAIPFDVVSKFTINPPLIIALDTQPGVPVVRKIWVFNNYSQQFEIGSVTSKNNYFTVLSQGKVNDGYQIEVQIMPPPANGKTNYNDELYIQIKNGEKLTIGCNGYYNLPKTIENIKVK